MPQLLIRTLGDVALTVSGRPIPIADPVAMALLCLTAFEPSGEVVETDALLRLTPDLTPAAGRARLAAAVAEINRAAGESVLTGDGGRFRLDRAKIDSDVEIAPDGEAGRGVPEFLARFQLPDSPEFAEWAVATRPRLRKRRGATSDPPTPTGRRTTVAIAMGGFLVLIAVYATRATPPPGFSRGGAIVLADLENTTGDTLFDRSLITAARIGLQQSPQLSLISFSRVLTALQRMGIASDTLKLTFDMAREVAVRENVKYAVGLRLESAGEGYRLTGTLADAAGGTIVTTSEATAETKAGTLNALDRVLQDIRGGLGERRTERWTNSTRLPAATTPSIEALRAYAIGTAAWSGGNYQVAKELWLRALDLDTGFAMAMGGLGAFYYHHHSREEGKRFYEDALRRVDRLTEWERLRLAEGFAGARGDTATSFALQRELIDKYPSSVSWYNYGTSLMQSGGRDLDAVAALHQALRYDSSFVPTFINLATVSKRLDKWDDATRFYERAGRIDSTILRRGNIGTEYGNLLMRQGRFEDADRHYRGMLSRTNLFDRILGNRGLAYLAVRRGRLDQAVGFFRQANEVAIQQRDMGKLSLMRGRLLEALTLQLMSDGPAADRALGQMLESINDRTEPQALALAGYGLGLGGKAAELERLVALARQREDTLNPIDRSSIRRLQGELAITRGQPDSAAELLLEAPLRRVHALAAARRFSDARKLAATLLDQPPIGHETQFEWFWAVVAAADAAAADNDRSAAVANYRRLVDYWAGGDSTATLLSYARRRIDELSRPR